MTKKEILELLEQHPEDIDPEQLMDELYVRAKIEKAESAIASGDVVSHEEVVKRSQEWFK